MNAILTEMIRGPWDELKCRRCGKSLTYSSLGVGKDPDHWEWNCATIYTEPCSPPRADTPIDFASPEGFVMALEWAGKNYRIAIERFFDTWRVYISLIGGPLNWIAMKDADSPAVALRAALCEARERNLI